MGYPYIFFTDNVNNNTVDVYKDKEMKIYASNMCSEIMLPSNEEESFVCDLSSMNIFYYDEWKDTDAVETLTYFLDAVMTDFLDKLKDLKESDSKEDNDSFEFMKRAYKFAKRHRAIGI
jgi:ribonucleotide-diphosphate reductase alpha subunit